MEQNPKNREDQKPGENSNEGRQTSETDRRRERARELADKNRRRTMK